MEPTSSSYAFMADTDAQPQRKRARQACISCNARRVKCNVTEQQPCANCLAAGIPCETRESRRGKHPRPSKKRRSIQSDATSVAGNNHEQHPDDVAGAHVLARLRGDKPTDASGQELVGPESVLQTEQQISPRQDPRQEDDGDVFLGESSSLRYVTSEGIPSATLSPTANARFRHSVPHFVKADALLPQWEIERRRARLNFIKSDGAFSLPPSHVVEGLLKAYFRWFHPCFAIVDEVDIWDQYRRGVLSVLLLQAMLFIGVLHCDESLLHEVGFDSPHRAKYLFYNRAKDIYDAEFERKKLTVIQALFLMSFWRAGALLEKDTRHWLGCAITLAQTKAMHRSAGTADTQELKLRKRVWWSLYTRDRQCAAALGLPNRVRDEDCDFEPLELSDFEHAFNPTVSKRQADEYASYAVTMTELATLLGNIVHSAYSPNKTFNQAHRAQMREELFKWRQQLPPEKRPGSETELGYQQGFFVNMQHLAYNNLLILLYRHDYILNEDEEGREPEGNLVLQTAAKSSRIIEDMLSEGNLRHGQIHVITNLFNTLCIHAVHLRRSDGTVKTVAEHRAKLCLLGLQELQKTWEVTNWVLSLFFQYLDRATAARLRVQEDDHMNATGQQLPNVEALIASQSAGQDFAHRSRLSIAAPDNGSLTSVTDVIQPGATPWSWSSEDANQFLFQQIENEFAFGEGEMLNWSPDDTVALSNGIFPPDMDPNFLQ